MPYITSVERIGIEKGRKEGRKEGREEGLRAGLLAGIEIGLELKFGTDGLQLLPDIRKLSDVEVLRAVHQAVLRGGTTLDELRRMVPPSGKEGNS